MKKIATLLLNNWLAETTQALAPRRHGRQSAERERNLKSTGMFLEKTEGWSHPNLYLRLVYPLSFSPVILIRLKKIATLLLNNWLAETTQALAVRRHGRQSAERERNLKSTGMFLEKTEGWAHLNLYF
ncbi:hypothetical protein ACSS6N_24670 [Peribacillus frigoritolerans]|uniref:hypothetical protein n=1 Tax=Peribacillus frigoritolerans TaxID=450367 RepID=UPI003F83AC17